MNKDEKASPDIGNKHPKSSIFQTIKAVMWSFVGLRARGDFERDVAQLNPLYIIAVGLVGVFVFVGSLMLLARLVVGS